MDKFVEELFDENLELESWVSAKEALFPENNIANISSNNDDAPSQILTMD